MSDLPALPRDPAEALQQYRPDLGHGPWGMVQAAHLLRRAVCGGSAAEVSRLARRPPADDSAAWTSTPPASATATATGDRDPLGALFAAAEPRVAAQHSSMGARLVHGEPLRLAAWWIMKLAAETRAPGARLTLFWHDHFACARSKVASMEAMRQQHELFVQHGEGPVDRLVTAMIHDVALLRFLDGDSNRRGAPNENLGRELLELFTLGVGHYDEHDVREAARALTGYTVRGERFHFEREHHADGPMNVLGQSVEDGDDLCRVAVAHPACPRFLADKLWRFLVSPDPPDDVLELLAERWQRTRPRRGLAGAHACWHVASVLLAADAYRSLVKSPVEYVVGVSRALGSTPRTWATLADGAPKAMGQTLLEPPGVQGWAGRPVVDPRRRMDRAHQLRGSASSRWDRRRRGPREHRRSSFRTTRRTPRPGKADVLLPAELDAGARRDALEARGGPRLASPRCRRSCACRSTTWHDDRTAVASPRPTGPSRRELLAGATALGLRRLDMPLARLRRQPRHRSRARPTTIGSCCSSSRAATTDSTPSCPTRTTPITGRGRGSRWPSATSCVSMTCTLCTPPWTCGSRSSTTAGWP